MFGNFAHIIPAPAETSQPSRPVPPPTPINFPIYPPQPDGDEARSEVPEGPLTAVLQSIIRPTEVTVGHLEALGLHVTSDAPIGEVIPHPELTLPDFAAWDELTRDECHARNEATRSPLSNGNLSPGCLVYLDRKRELSTSNEAAFRAVRRIQPPKGQSQARLGNSYEFFRFLEMFAAYWDDTSRPPKTPAEQQQPPDDGKGGESSAASDASADSADKTVRVPAESVSYRTGAGHQMPPEFRQNILTAFLKLVAYDFGCNVSPPRVEPRLYITSTLPGDPPGTRSSYFSSGCTFMFRTPTTREAARSGIVEGPLAAVSARHTVSFPSESAEMPSPASTTDASPTSTRRPSSSKSTPERDALMDLSRELIAALLTAQHRARQHKAEVRVGEGAWWATKPRWGGGSGGPIGREVDMLASDDAVLGDKDAPPPETSSPPAPGASLSGPYFSAGTLPSRLAADGGPKGAKRLKKSSGPGTLPMYDGYRMVRPPSAAWDRKVRYEAVGRVPGAGPYDDVFVVSSLFHHISVVRVRVPDRLLEVLDGAPEDPPRSWGRLPVWRSRWYDFFKVEDRVEAMQLLWGVMTTLTLRREGEGGGDGVGR